MDIVNNQYITYALMILNFFENVHVLITNIKSEFLLASMKLLTNFENHFQ
jgi:hypothetical protein